MKAVRNWADNFIYTSLKSSLMIIEYTTCKNSNLTTGLPKTPLTPLKSESSSFNSNTKQQWRVSGLNLT